MSHTLRAMFPALLLSLSLTQVMPAVAADPAPAPDAAPTTAPTDAPVERPPLLSREQEEAQALEQRLPAQELQQLQAGDTPFLALWKPANSDDPQGAVVIVSGAGESVDWPNVVGPLRRKFPDIGWATLSLPLPDTQDPALQAREAEPATDAEPAARDGASEADKTSAAPAPTEDAAAQAAAAHALVAQVEAEQIFARIDSAIAFAVQNKSRSIVLLGHSSGAYWATRYANERASSQVQRLILVGAREPAGAVPSLLDLIPNLKVKTADFIYKNRPNGSAEQRLQASKRTKGPGFTQVGLVDIAGNAEAEQEQIFRRVRGWVEAQ